MTPKQESWYNDVLMRFCGSRGQRYALVTSLSWAAASLGISADEVIEDCRAAMPDFTSKHASDIRRGITSASQKVNVQQSHENRPDTRSAKERPSFKVRELIASGGMTAQIEDLKTLSPTPTTFSHRGYQTSAFLNRIWMPDEYLHINDSQRHSTAVLGNQIRTRNEWLELLRDRPLPGDIISRNSLSGKEGRNKEGKPSYTSADCISSFRYVMLEFDHLPIPEQCAFWLGIFRTMPQFARHIVSLVHSGGKSIHGLLRIGVDARSPERIRQEMFRQFCTDPDESYRADRSGFIAYGGTRLAGAKRRSNGEIQRLLFLA